MRIQGGSEEESDTIKVGKSGGEVKPIQEVYKILSEFFKLEREFLLFEVLSSIKNEEQWVVRALLQYKSEIRIVTIEVGREINSIREEFRSNK
jgi:hypothetical protein